MEGDSGSILKSGDLDKRAAALIRKTSIFPDDSFIPLRQSGLFPDFLVNLNPNLSKYP